MWNRDSAIWAALARPSFAIPVYLLVLAMIAVFMSQGSSPAVASTLPVGVNAPAPAVPARPPLRLREVKVETPAAPRPLGGRIADGAAWRTRGYTPQPVAAVPYTYRMFSEKVFPANVDKDGVLVYERDGKRYYHPVAMLQYSLAELDIFHREFKPKALARAEANAAMLIKRSVRRDGGMYFPYRFDFPLGGDSLPIKAPWWSAMAQGQALSLFVRLFQTSGQQRWLTAAEQVFHTMGVRGPTKGDRPWTTYVDSNHYLWFEEYAGSTLPLMVLNGDMFAIFGLWDYYGQTHDPRARELFDAAATTLREYLPLYRVRGGISYYCLRAPFCQQSRWQNKKYHVIVTHQLDVLAGMTGDRWFKRESTLFAQDFPGNDKSLLDGLFD